MIHPNQTSESDRTPESGWAALLGIVGIGPTTNRTMFAPFAFAIPLACAWLLLSSTRVELTEANATASQSFHQQGLRLNPNTATWSDLTLLPRIGEITAKRIVKYRTQTTSASQSPAFKQPADLEAVKGIGPKTVAGIAKYLKFN